MSIVLVAVTALAVGYALALGRSAPTPPAPSPPLAPAVARPAPSPPPAPTAAPPEPAGARDVPEADAGPPRVTVRAAARDCSGANDLLAWGCRAPVAGLSCARVVRAAGGGQPEAANYLCAAPEANLQWLESRPAAGSECAQVMVPRGRNAWSGAFLCAAADGPLTLRVSYARPIDGADCIEAWEPWTARRGTQNYLCGSARATRDGRDAGMD